MSAITGIYHLNTEPINMDHVRLLMESLKAFPADDIQTWYKDNIFLGCHAQWITPESIGERLPHYDSERQLGITADAIIDNRQELFDLLHVERNHRNEIPDSELILLAYHKWGEDTPKYLVGDFAFMIWDEKRQQLFGARDPSGYRTLYYHNNQSRFAFCTTIEALLSLPYVHKELNEQWLAEYLAISAMIDTVDARMTPYKGIEQVPPFHSITVRGNQTELKRYGAFLPEKPLKLNSEEEYVEAFKEVFQNAVVSRLRTHRNIGSQLSGGLDSGAVVGFAAKALRGSNKVLHTFSYVPPKDFVNFTSRHYMPNETPMIKKTTEYVGGVSEHYCDFEGRSSYTEINDFLDVMEMPYKFFENSFWLKGIFEKASEEGIGVLLNGDKGNSTISWGPALDYYAGLLKNLRWIRLYKELNQYSQNTGGARLRQLPVITRIAFPFVNRSVNNPSKIINSEFASRTKIFEKLRAYGIDDSGWLATSNVYEQRKMQFGKMFPWNAGNTLISKLSLRYGLWKRDPTNDIRVVRFCLSVPEEQYVQKGLDRALIRKSTKNLLPDQVRLNQRVKGIQGADWVHRMLPSWKAFIEEMKQLSEDHTVLQYMNGQEIRKAIAASEQGARREDITDPNYRTLMRSLIVYRFIKKFA